MRKTVIFSVICLLSVLLCPVTAFAAKEIVEPSDALYVSDYADVLSTETEQQVISWVDSLKELCGGEIAVVTIDFLTGGLDSEEYAYEIINQWGVGDAEKQNGCVLLLVVGEGKGWCTVGTGAERFLSAGRLEQILNKLLWPAFDAGDYDRAVLETVEALVDQYESNYGIQIGVQEDPVYGDSYGGESVYDYTETPPRRSNVGRSLIRLFVLLLIISAFTGMGGGRTRRRRAFFWFGFPTAHHHHHHHHGPRPPYGGFGGGSRGGFSGGGRGFGGGGGRGGGAGRR